MYEHFRKFARKMSKWLGKPIAFLFALFLILAWLIAGPYFNWSDSHGLFINTVTNIITFLFVFIIQNSHNRDHKSLRLKVDELIRSNENARKFFLKLDHLSDCEIKKLEKEFEKYHKNKKWPD